MIPALVGIPGCPLRMFGNAYSKAVVMTITGNSVRLPVIQIQAVKITMLMVKHHITSGGSQDEAQARNVHTNEQENSKADRRLRPPRCEFDVHIRIIHFVDSQGCDLGGDGETLYRAGHDGENR